MTLKSLLGILEIIIQNHFKSHMLEPMLIGIVSFLKLLEIGMHSLHLLYPLLNLLRIASLDSHHWWDLENSPLIRWPWWMYVSWCVTSKLFWFWFWFWYIDVPFKPTVKTLMRRRIMRRLIWVCTVCLCPIYRTLGIDGLTFFAVVVVVLLMCSMVQWHESWCVPSCSTVDVSVWKDHLSEPSILLFE